MQICWVRLLKLFWLYYCCCLFVESGLKWMNEWLASTATQTGCISFGSVGIKYMHVVVSSLLSLWVVRFLPQVKAENLWREVTISRLKIDLFNVNVTTYQGNCYSLCCKEVVKLTLNFYMCLWELGLIRSFTLLANSQFSEHWQKTWNPWVRDKRWHHHNIAGARVSLWGSRHSNSHRTIWWGPGDASTPGRWNMLHLCECFWISYRDFRKRVYILSLSSTS